VRKLPLVALSVALSLQIRPCSPQDSNWNLTGWHLVWSDEFNGPALDSSNWKAQIGDGSPQNPGWGNRESEYYTDSPDNLRIVKDGALSVLRLTARAQRHGSEYYTSARITTQGKRSFQFGRLEARIRLPQGKGLWPAFWMLGDSFSSKGWPSCGEIDILEMQGGSDAAILGTIHWGGPDRRHESSIPGVCRLQSGVFADGYHLFGVEWDDKAVSWYMDGTQYASEPVTQADRAAFRSGKFFVLLNLAVGGDFVAYQIPPMGFTDASMDVDWVRWYQKD